MYIPLTHYLVSAKTVFIKITIANAIVVRRYDFRQGAMDSFTCPIKEKAPNRLSMQILHFVVNLDLNLKREQIFSPTSYFFKLNCNEMLQNKVVFKLSYDELSNDTGKVGLKSLVYASTLAQCKVSWRLIKSSGL